jgi:hypothetical protein
LELTIRNGSISQGNHSGALDAAHESAENVRRAWCFPLIEVCSEMKKRQRDSEDTGAE